jgi:large subunit ribosomal protein L11
MIMSQENKQVATIKLKVVLGSATLGGNISSSLGQKGVSAKMFCDNFNELTKHLKGKVTAPVLVKVRVFADKSIQISYGNTLNTTDLVKEALGLKTLKTPTTGRLTIKRSKVEEIAKKKQEDLCVVSLEKAIKTIEGTLRSMAINIED